MEEDNTSVNNILWQIGWHPLVVFTAMAVIGGVVGVIGMSFNPSLIVLPASIGLFVVFGVVLWVWGVQEINSNFEEMVNRFVSKQERGAAQALEIPATSTYSLLHRLENSPVIIKPAKQYEHTIIVLGESSITINKDALFDVEKHKLASGGRNRELFYDQIATVNTYDEGDYSVLQIGSGVDSIEITSVYTNKIENAASDLRRRVRTAKN